MIYTAPDIWMIYMVSQPLLALCMGLFRENPNPIIQAESSQLLFGGDILQQLRGDMCARQSVSANKMLIMANTVAPLRERRR